MARSSLIGLILVAAVSTAWAQAVPVANGDFASDLAGSWVANGAAGEVTGDGETLCMRKTTGTYTVVQQRAIPIRPGQSYKLTGWLKLDQATGATYMAVEGLRDGQVIETLGKTRELDGTFAPWMPQWLVIDLPADSRATHFRLALHSDDNSGSAWFDDISLKRLPPNRPVVDGQPGPPRRGQVLARDGHLVDESGQRLRLWGINCVDELGRDYRQITHTVRRIKAMGFNAIRLHLYDIRLIDMEARNAAGELTTLEFLQGSTRGDGSVSDLLDYFMYRAEREGLYLYLTFDRGRGAFGPGDYDVLPPGDEQDAREWKQAVAETNKGWANEHLYFVDERLGAAHVNYAGQQLDHRNAYTGVRIADDPYVALWELTNENSFPLVMLDGRFRQWPEYFQRVAQRRWNEWLEGRYSTQEKLLAAWGAVKEGEQLDARNIAAAPCDTDADDYPDARHADFRRFVYELTLAHCHRLEEVLKQAGRCSARAPVSYDTIFEHKHTWYYPMSQGSFQAVGTYVGGSLELRRENSWLGAAPKHIYNYSNATVADKPIVVYENNINRPAADRAYYPMFLSTFASTHDWDGVFWYLWADGSVPDLMDDEAYGLNGLRYAAPSHIWHGIVTATDEVFLAALRLGGEMFTRFAIPAAPDPVIITAGANDLLGRTTWIGDLKVPFPKDAPGPYPESSAMGATDFVSGTRYRYALDEPSSVSRPLIPVVPEVCEPVEGLTYDFSRGTISVDRPEAKAVVGFTGGNWRFSDGTAIRAGECPFFCYGLVPLDGKPLAQSREALAIFSTYGENRGRVLRENPDEVKEAVPHFAKLIAAWGWGPPELARPALQLTFPAAYDFTGYDFAQKALYRLKSNSVKLPAGQQLMWATLRR